MARNQGWRGRRARRRGSDDDRRERGADVDTIDEDTIDNTSAPHGGNGAPHDASQDAAGTTIVLPADASAEDIARAEAEGLVVVLGEPTGGGDAVVDEARELTEEELAGLPRSAGEPEQFLESEEAAPADEAPVAALIGEPTGGGNAVVDEARELTEEELAGLPRSGGEPEQFLESEEAAPAEEPSETPVNEAGVIAGEQPPADGTGDGEATWYEQAHARFEQWNRVGDQDTERFDTVTTQ